MHPYPHKRGREGGMEGGEGEEERESKGRREEGERGRKREREEGGGERATALVASLES